METEARELLAKLEQRRPSRIQFWGPLLVIIFIAVLCYGFSWIEGQRQVKSVSQYDTSVFTTTPWFILMPGHTATHFSYLSVETGTGENDDLFIYSTTFTKTIVFSLTQTPMITEAWPVLNPTADQVAYYAIRNESIDLYLLSLTNGLSVPLTESTGNSGLHTNYEITTRTGPVFSPDSQWVAFLGQGLEFDIIELFLASTTNQQVLRVDSRGYGVYEYDWLDNSTLLVTTQSADKRIHRWTVSIFSPDGLKLQPLN